MPSSVHIRERLPSDISTLTTHIAAVHAASGYPVEGASTPASFLAPPNAYVAFVAEIDGEGTNENLNGDVVGQVVLMPASTESAMFRSFASCYPDRGVELVAVMGRLFIAPAAQGCGAGKGLVRRALEWARGEGKVVLLNVLDKDRKAIALYDKMGWKRVGEGTYVVREGESEKQWGETYFAWVE